jgi:hypothetical protein
MFLYCIQSFDKNKDKGIFWWYLFFERFLTIFKKLNLE